MEKHPQTLPMQPARPAASVRGPGWKAVLLSAAAAFAVGGGLVGWMAWERGFDIGALVGMEQAVREIKELMA